MHAEREPLAISGNPLGLDGIEFIEFSTTRPQALSQVFERLGFRPIARHRSREVLLLRQGDMNVVINAHDARLHGAAGAGDQPRIAAVALRVRDAAQAYRRMLDLGAWPVALHVEVMELNIPGIHGVGSSRIYLIDRYREFSIYDVDFVMIPTVGTEPPALAGLHWFGVVQYIGLDRMQDWIAFYTQLLGMRQLEEDVRFGILPKGRILESPCGKFFLQVIEPELDACEPGQDELLHRIALGTPDVPVAVAQLAERGVSFVETPQLHTDAKGALTQPLMGGVMVELVKHAAVLDVAMTTPDVAQLGS